MLYLLDSNVLIDANRDYYPMEMVPEFWRWLVEHGRSGDIAVPQEMFDEVTGTPDGLGRWLASEEIRNALLLREEADPAHVAYVVNTGYAPDLRDDEIEWLGQDPFLLAYAWAAPAERCVVTTERSRPGRLRANRHIPDVCGDLGIRCCHTFQLTRLLGFRTR